MASSDLQPVSRAFARTMRRLFVLELVLVVVGFAAISARLFHSRAKQNAIAQARLCAAALVPGQGGDLTRSAHRLRSRYSGFLAVATLDSSGRLQTLYPERPEYRRAATAALERQPELAASTIRIADQRTRLWGVVVSLNGDPSPVARRVLVLLADESRFGAWGRATILLAIIAALGIAVGCHLATRWFEHRIAAPLRNLGQVPGRRGQPANDAPDFPSSGWRELERIAERFRGFVRGLGESENRARRAEHEAQLYLKYREAGFDRQLRRAKDQATLDALTGLRNRLVFNEEFEPLVACQRAKRLDLAVVVLDVDNFKCHNDTYGHAAGDEILRFIGELLGAALRPGDLAIRYGGDEFVLLLPGVDARQAGGIIQRFVKLFARYVVPIGAPKPLSLSAGITTLGDHPQATAQELFTRADEALYAAKRKGKNAVMAG